MGSLRSLRRNHVGPVIIPMPSDAELIAAFQFGTVKQVKALLERGANPDAVDELFENALGYAVSNGKLGMTQLLVRYGADVNQRNAVQFAALHLVVSSGENLAQEICAFLLDNGADINAADRDGWTPLMNAVHSKHFDIAKLLLDRGADATVTNSNGTRALDLLRRGKGSTALRKLLEQVS